MKTGAHGFGRLARVYRGLEFAAFGRSLERTRFALLDHLRDCRRILLLGEGDGRCLQRLLRVARQARFDCVDFSPQMLERAERRLSVVDRERTRFLRLDVVADALPDASYDAVVSLFFLDCFTDEQLTTLVPRIAQHLQPGALWLWADFALPERGFARIRARCWLRLLYGFFAWQTSLSARALPDAASHIAGAGFVIAEERIMRSGLLRCAIFRDHRKSPLAPPVIFPDSGSSHHRSLEETT